ncbi:MAG: nuclear transport factor 2 family protein [Candidatus Bathyarchaeota archaeon]
MDYSKRDRESVRVKKVLDDWFNAMTEQDYDRFLTPLSDEYIQHLPGTAPIVGREGLKGIFDAYKAVLGPIHHVESKITVSDSGDMAYEIGRHDHVMYDGSGGSHLSPWNHIIVLKKVDGVWLIDGISETNIEPEK